MTLPVRFESEAASELEEAVAWYEAQHAGLGAELLAAVDPVVEDVGRWPEAGAPVRGVPAELRVRKAPVARFPYYLAYLIMAEEVRILAMAHTRREPSYWHRRLER